MASDRSNAAPDRRRRRPIATLLLIAANVAVHVGVIGNHGLEQHQLSVWEGEYYRIFTATFVHAHWGHLFVNCFGLYIIGSVVERVYGARRFLLIYFVSGLVGGLAFQGFSKGVIGIGASGAVYGVFGAFLPLRYGKLDGDRVRLRIAFFVALILIPCADWLFARWIESAWHLKVALSAHAGGFFCGVLLGYGFLVRRDAALRTRSTRVLIATSVVIVGLGIYSCFWPAWNPLWAKWRATKSETFDATTFAGAVQGEDGSLELLMYALRLQIAVAINADDMNAAGGAEESAPSVEEIDARFEQVVRTWGESGQYYGADHYREFGYLLYDELMARGRDELAATLLADLIVAARTNLRASQRESAGDRTRLQYAHHLNELAWCLALKHESLQEALQLATTAVAAVTAEETGFMNRLLGGGRAASPLEASMFVNTLGWVEFLIAVDPQSGLSGSESAKLREDGLRHLREATHLFETGANFLYLGLAHAMLGEADAAMPALSEAESRREQLSPYERRLLEDARHGMVP